MRNKFQLLWDSFSTWGWPAKFLAGASVSAFAGGGVLSFLLEHAGYSFALNYGFRPPVEGMPYLVPLVTFASIALLILAAVFALILILTFKYLVIKAVELIDSIGTKDFSVPSLLLPLRRAPTWVALPVIATLAAMIVAVGHLILPMPVSTRFELCAWPLLLCTSDQPGKLAFLLTHYFFAAMMFLMLWRPTLIWVGTFLAVAATYVSIALAVLPSDGYARLLRMTGFGGGIHVTLYFDAKATASSQPFDTYLLMRSSTHAFVYTPEDERIREYPLASVSQISHRQGGLHDLRWRLPPATSLVQR